MNDFNWSNFSSHFHLNSEVQLATAQPLRAPKDGWNLLGKFQPEPITSWYFWENMENEMGAHLGQLTIVAQLQNNFHVIFRGFKPPENTV